MVAISDKLYRLVRKDGIFVLSKCVPDIKSCSPNMMGGRVVEYINKDTREVSQFEDKPHSEQTYLRDFEKDDRNIRKKMTSCDDCSMYCIKVP
jgi:hypothetical protein